MKRLSLFALLSLTLWIFCGCGKGAGAREPGWIVGASDRKIEEMDKSDVIVAVNGSELTKERYDQMLANNEKVLMKKKPSADKGLLSAILKGRKSAIIREYINRELYLYEAKSRGLKMDPEIKAKIEAIYSAQAKQGGQSIEELAGGMGESKAELQQRINEVALIETLMRAEFGDKLELTEEDVEKAKARITKYNQMCDATNQLVVARGARIVSELRAGADFKKMAEQYSEAEEDEGGYWDEFTRYEIDDANVRHAAFNLPVGAVSDPFDTDMGLLIIKILERTGIDAVGAEEEAVVKLGRILLRMGELKVCPPDNELRKEVAMNKKNYYQIPFIAQIQDKSRIEFPNGTNFWDVSNERTLMPAASN